MTFKELGLHEKLIEAISWMGFETATPIQEQAIPIILEGHDLIGCAQTGTGKTAAFLLPILDKLAENPEPGTSTLIICPTRELALQIDNQIQALSYFVGVHSIPVYGGGSGQDWEDQKKAISKGAEIIVGTPGKLISHLNMPYMKLKKLKYLILDEADRMLDIGFHDDIIKIIGQLPKDRQTLMFSATMPNNIKSLAKKILKSPKEISLAISKPAAGVLQGAYLVYDAQKIDLVNSLIKDKPKYKSIIIFCSTKKKVSELTRSLSRQSYTVEAISSDLEQREREDVLSRFRSRRTRVLIGTDVISRGIDIADINLVINYDVPGEAADYVHRIGRTARADTTGVALTLINEDDMYKFHKIEELIEKEVMKIPLPKELGEGPAWSTAKRRKSFGSKSGNRGGQRKKWHKGGRRPKGKGGHRK